MPATTGGFTKSYVSSTAFLDKREILNKVLDITNEETSFLDIMELTGRSNVTAVPTYHHFVNEELYVVATIAASPAISGSGTAASPLVVPIDATAFAATNVGEIAMLKDGRAAYVKAKGASNTLTLVAVDNTALGSYASGDKIAFPTNANAEGSGSPDAKKWGISKIFNQVQIFKQKYEITDIQKASQVEVEFQGKPFYMYKGQHESLMKFRSDISAGLFLSRISSTKFEDANPALVDADGKPIQTTMGVDQYITTYGIQDTLTSSSQVALGDLARLTQTLNAARAPQEYFMFVGTSMNIFYDNLLNGLGNSQLLSQGLRFEVNGKSLELGIDTFKIYGRTYHKKLLNLLDHKNLTAYTGAWNFSSSAYFIPADKQKTVDGQMVDRLGVRYMAGDGTDLKYREKLLGGLAPVPTNEKDVLEIHYSSTQGLEILGSQYCVKQKIS